VTAKARSADARLLLVTGCTAVAGAAAVAALLRRRLAAVTVQGRSMEPTYRHGDRVLVRRAPSIAPGQVVVVERPGEEGTWPDAPVPVGSAGGTLCHRHWLIKRVVAVPGDPAPRGRVPQLPLTPGDRVPSGCVVVLGDNTELSLDSRMFGYLPTERILGTVLCLFARGAPAPRVTS
jgi:signal peptidase I